MTQAGGEPSVPRTPKPEPVHFGGWANCPWMSNGDIGRIAAPESHGRRPQRLLRCGRRLVTSGRDVRSHGAHPFDA